MCRRLYKGIDAGAVLESHGEAAITRFKMKLREAKKAGVFGPIDIFEDTVKRNPYQHKDLETPEVLSKVLIRRSDGTNFEDLRDCSDVVRGLEEKARVRVYFRDLPTRRKLEKLLGEV